MKKKLSTLIRQLMSIHFTDQRSEYVQNKLKCAFNNTFENTWVKFSVANFTKSLVFKQISFAFYYVGVLSTLLN